MASWRGWGSQLAGRFSPFTRSPASGGELADSAFSYITEEDLKRNAVERSHGDEGDGKRDGAGVHRDHHHHHHKHSHADTGRSREDLSGKDTDSLILKNKRQAYTVHFPALSIDKGELLIGDIRAAAAKKMGTSASSIKMLYKGRNLKEDGRQARDEGLSSGRQSELLCVVGDAAPASPDEDDEDEDEEEFDGFDDSPAGGDASSKGKKKRKNRKKKPRRSDQGAGGSLSSSSAATSGTTTAPSASATFIPPSHIPTPVSRSSASTPVPAASNTPQTAVDKIKVLVTKFETELLPLCEAFVTHPPSDKAKRDFEHKKLTETIMGQVLLKLDGVEPEGDPEARMKRKEAVKDVNAWLAKLDKVVSA